MSFIKYCKKKHHIDVAETIRLGTFYGYRNHEKDEIKDENEGISDGLHIAPNETIHPNTPEQIEQFNSAQNFITLKYTNPNIIPNNSIKNLKIIGKTNLPNCFLFSCSESPLNADLMKKLEYNSYYEIIDIEKFSSVVTKSLGTELQKQQIWEEPITIRTNWEKVIYGNQNLPDPLKSLHSDFAQKKKMFASEHEYRLIFILTKSNNRVISVENQPIDLKVTDEIRRCCTWN